MENVAKNPPSFPKKSYERPQNPVVRRRRRLYSVYQVHRPVPRDSCVLLSTLYTSVGLSFERHCFVPPCLGRIESKLGVVLMLKVLLIVVQGKPEGKSIPLTGPVFRIGRGPDCHLRPNSEEISRNHAQITTTETDAILVDLGSRNGTRINGKPITGPHKLRSGELLQIGPLTFAIAIQGASAASAPATQPGSPTAASGARPASLDDVPQDQIEAWLVSDRRKPTPDRPSGVYDGDTLTIDAYKEGLGSKSSVSIPTTPESAPAAPPAPTPAPPPAPVAAPAPVPPPAPVAASSPPAPAPAPAPPPVAPPRHPRRLSPRHRSPRICSRSISTVSSDSLKARAIPSMSKPRHRIRPTNSPSMILRIPNLNPSPAKNFSTRITPSMSRRRPAPRPKRPPRRSPLTRIPATPPAISSEKCWTAAEVPSRDPCPCPNLMNLVRTSHRSLV